MNTLTKILNILQYWENIDECVCDSTTPIGGCLKCDMRECIDGIIMLKQDGIEAYFERKENYEKENEGIR